MLGDFRYALRMLRNTPGFTVVAILTLAVGIGANTTIFSAINALLLRPLPIENPERVTCGYAMRDGIDPYETSLLEYVAYRERSHSFSSSGIGSQSFFTLNVLSEPQRVRGATVTAEYLSTLGVKPAIGRLLRADEDQPGGPAVMLISYELWQRLFAGNPTVIGQQLKLEEGNYTIVGVLPHGFNMPFAAELWVPLQLNVETVPLDQRRQPAYDFVARLKDNVTLAQADAELKEIARSLEQEYPQFRHGWSYKLISLRQNLIGDLEGKNRKALFALVAAVAFVLLICCANLANLLLARGIAREREISIRFALGASRSQIVRQVLTESLLLAVFGGLAGLILTYWIAPILAAWSPVQAVSLGNFLRDFRIDTNVVVFCFVLSLLTAAVFGLVPALKLIRSRDLITIIKQRDQRAGGVAAGQRVLNLLVIGQIAVAAALLVAGGLLVQSFQNLQRIKLGFHPDNLLLVEIPLSPNKYRKHPQRVSFTEQLLERVKALPGVSSAAITTNFPLELYDAASAYTVDGSSPVPGESARMTIHRLVSPDYFKTLGATIVKGRASNEQDTAQSSPVVVINQELVRKVWPGEDPIGKRIRRGGFSEKNFPWMTVVGVVENIKEDRFNFRTDRPAWYLPYAQQESNRPLRLVVRARVRPTDLIGPIRDALRSLDPNQPISQINIMQEYLSEVLIRERFSAMLMGALAGIGFFLAVIGLYGVMAYSVGRRRGEIGLRLVLGAQPRDVFRLLLGKGARLIASGLVIGLVGARVIIQGFSATLYQTNATDPLIFALVTIVLATVALMACYFPARSATQVNPVEALRSE